MKIEEAKKILLANLQTFTPKVQNATQTILSEFENLQKNLAEALAALKSFGLDEETLIATPNAVKFLESLPALPFTYSAEEKPFIEKLNAAVSVLRKNPLVWMNKNNLPHEIWRDVIGYEGFFQVSNYCRLKSIKRNREKMIHFRLDDFGYFRCTLHTSNHEQLATPHRIIAIAFIPNPENKSQVNHKDGNKENCCIWNLEWATPSENVRHAYRIGLCKAASGENHHMSKLTNEDVKLIKKIHKPYDKNFGSNALARCFGVSHKSIHSIIYGETYKNIIPQDWHRKKRRLLRIKIKNLR